ncbi:MAG: InlB B-repeat-containing protein [Candidatus Brocadiia bacterium]
MNLQAPATDPAGYTFSQWTVNGAAQTAGLKSITFTLTAATTAVAQYTLNTYVLTVQSTPPAGLSIGSSVGDGGTTNYTVSSVGYGTSVNLAAPATDPTGYTFSKWTVNGVAQTAGLKSITFTLTAATTAVAQYTLNTYVLTVQSTPPTGLSIGSSAGDGGTTNYTVPSVGYGTSVNLQAPATDPAGYTFSQWTVNGVAQTAGLKSITFMMTAATTAVAQYALNTYVLAVQSTPPTGVVVTSSTADGGTTNYTVPSVGYGTSVNLQAPATDPAGYTFSQWTLNGTAQTAGVKSVTFTMAADTTAVAQYLPNTYTLTVLSTDFAVTFASFGWLTNSENGVFFTTGDKVSGLIWSNGQFNINGNPVFNGPVYTGAATLNYMNGGPPNDNPTFADGIIYNAPALNFSSVINGNDIPAIQSAADIGGVSEPSNNGNGYSLTFNTGGTFTLVKNGSGGPHGTAPVTLYNNAAISATNGAFYFQDTVQVSGTITGQVTIGTSLGNDIDITNNLVYSYPANPATMFAAGFNQSDPLLVSKCALVSGGNVVINPASWAAVPSDMYITASCTSVTGSFENVYYTSSPAKTLHVYGGIVQCTRGAVGTTAGTGFIENYVFDTRFTLAPPPFLPVIIPAVPSAGPTGVSIGSNSDDGGTTNYTVPSVAYGTSVDLVAPATDPTGYTFSCWTLNGTPQPAGQKEITPTMPATATTAVAVYMVNNYTLTVQSTPPTGIAITSISGDSGTTNYTVPSVGYGTSVNLQAPATDPAGYTFSQWTVNGVAQTAGLKSITFTMPAAAVTAVAQYTLNTYTLTVQSTPPTGLSIGSSTGDAGTTNYSVVGVAYGTSVDLVAPATDPAGYTFSCWTLNGTPQPAGEKEIAPTLTAAMTAVAQYTMNVSTLMVQSTPPTGLSIGSSTGDVGTTSYTVPGITYGTSVNLQAPATDPAGYTFSQWTLNGTAQTSGLKSITFTMSAGTTAVAQYTAITCTLTVQSTPPTGLSIGSSTGDGATTNYTEPGIAYGTSVNLQAPATDPAGYTFSQWTVNGAAQTAGQKSVTFTMAADTTAVAQYTLNTYTLTVQSTPPTGIVITSSTADGGTTNYTVSSVGYGTSVNLAAPATDPLGYTFSQWTVNGAAQTAGLKSITFTLTAATTAVAQYTLNTYTLTVQSTPPTGLSIGSSAGDGGTTNYTVVGVAYGTSVDLQAPATDPAGYTFSCWTLNGTPQPAGEKEITPTLTAATTAVAQYTLNTYALTVQSTPPTGIVITSSTADGGATNYTVPSVGYGTSANLQAPATDPVGYTFSQWTVNGAAQTAGLKSITFTLTAATTAVAQYTLNTYALTVQSTPPTGLSIGSSTGNNGTTSYTNTVAYGTSVDLQAPATDPAGYTFSYWTLNGTPQPAGEKEITPTMPATAMTAVAVYTVNTYTLTVQSTPPTGVVVTSSTADGGTTNYTVTGVGYGTSVNLAAPATDPTGYTFSKWTVNGTAQTAGQKSVTFTMTAATTAVAQYTASTGYTLTVESTPPTGVAITSSTGDGGTTNYTVSSVAHGTKVNLVAPATDPTGYTFSKWTVNGTAQTAGLKSITFTLTAATTAVAQYTAKTYTLTVQSTPPTGAGITSSTGDGGKTNYTVSSVAYGTSVNLAAPATDPTGYTFSKWTVKGVAQTAGQKSVTFTLTAATTAVAQYTANIYAVTVQSTPPTGIAITSSTGDGGKTSYTVSSVAYGTKVNLAAPATNPTGYTFSKWTLNGVAQTAGQKSITFTLTGATTAVAQYTLNTYTLTVESMPATGVVITSSTGDGGKTSYTVSSVAYGTSVNLAVPATDPTGYTFEKWTVNGVTQPAGQKSITITVTGSTTAMATYARSTH